MKVPAPHFLLFSESSRKQRQGQWRFLLQAVDGTEQLEAADAEPDVQGERLELLAVVRGLEALDQPSRVTLVTPSKYVHRGLLYGLEEWRTNGWSWEHFGQMVPVKNRDLWQRLDHAMTVHELEFQPWRWDRAVAAGSEQLVAEPLVTENLTQSLTETSAGSQTDESTSAALPAGLSATTTLKPRLRPKTSAWSFIRVACERWLGSRWDVLRLRLVLAAGWLIPRLRVG
jgi:ribonuclease HI